MISSLRAMKISFCGSASRLIFHGKFIASCSGYGNYAEQFLYPSKIAEREVGDPNVRARIIFPGLSLFRINAKQQKYGLKPSNNRFIRNIKLLYKEGGKKEERDNSPLSSNVRQ